MNGPAGEPLYRISVIQNITERKRAEEQLKQAQRMEAIGRLAGGVAHDFNTLLNVMLGYSELLLDELPEGDARRERVLQIKNSGDAGALLTKQLLALSRKQSITQEVLDLRDIASQMTPILGRLLRDDIELTVKCCEELCPVKVDPGQLQQLMLNLTANAADAMPNGGHLDFEVRVVQLHEIYVQQHPTLKVGRYVVMVIAILELAWTPKPWRMFSSHFSPPRSRAKVQDSDLQPSTASSSATAGIFGFTANLA